MRAPLSLKKKWPGHRSIVSIPFRTLLAVKAILLQKHLEKNGFLAIAIRPPTVPVNESRIRLTIIRN